MQYGNIVHDRTGPVIAVEYVTQLQQLWGWSSWTT